MIGVKVKLNLDFPRLKRAAKKGAIKSISHAAASIRKTAIASIEPSDDPSPPGTPPHTRKRVSKKGKQLKGHLQRAIVYSVDQERQNAVIGPRESVVGTSAEAHEFGGEYKGAAYPERPFMGPALDKNTDRFGSEFRGSIGE